ncbi:hypothetical protein GGI20_005952, partial [Coemansia sp. BCRC 34301]
NENTKERGWFPSNFVSKVTESKVKSSKSKRCVRCIKRFVVDEEDENYQDLIPLEVGDIIEVGKELEGWYMGTVHGRKGLFPASHVEEVSSSAAKESKEKTHRPLPVPPSGGAMSPPPTSLSRQGTGSGVGGAPQAPPPALPQRQPPLPPRASTDIPRGSDKRHSYVVGGGDDGGDDSSKKDKQKSSGHRISRLFGTKKYKNREAGESPEAAAHIMSPQADEQRVLDDDIHDEKDEETSVDNKDALINEEANNEEAEASVEATDDSESIKPRGEAKLAKIISDYEAQQPEELNLMSGDVVTIISRGTEDDARWKGEYHGKKGYFPASVVDVIEESANLDEEDASGEAGARPKGGFKLAAYGVQQGGIGSIFAGGGLPSLRKAAPPPRKTDDDEGGVAAPVPAMAPVIPKLRSVQRPAVPAPKDEPKEEQVNFLAQLNRVPRRQTSSIPDEGSMSPLPVAPAAAPPLPLSRKSTAADDASAADDDMKEQEEEEEEEAAVDAVVPSEEVQDEGERELALADEAEAEEQLGADEDAETSSRTSSLDPVKSPALAGGVKRLVRRAPRQKPTAEGLKKQSEESQSQALHSALSRDKDVEPEPEPEPARAAPPVLPEKPKGLARHGQFSGPQLPTGGFKPSGRVGSAMASRLAALQARASGGGADDDGADEGSAAPPSVPRAAPPSVSRAAPSAASLRSPPEPLPQLSKAPSVSAEWQRQIEDEQVRLRSDADAAKRTADHVDRLVERLDASERASNAHLQTIAALERQVEALAAQLATMQSGLSGVQRSVSSLESNRAVTADEVTAIAQAEVKAVTQPLHDQGLELCAETKVLHTKIADLRAYVDELVVEEEAQ